MDTAKELLKACQDYFNGLGKKDFRDKGRYYAAEALKNRLWTYHYQAIEKPEAGKRTTTKKG